MDGITNSMDMSLSKLQETVKDRKPWCAVVHGVTKVVHDSVTEQQQKRLAIFIQVIEICLYDTV